MKKIAIIGSGGSGKSTLASKLGAILNLPVFHLDALNWKPGWVPTPKEEWNQLMKDLVAQDQWIIDGNYGGTMQIRLQEADTIIYLDYPTYISLSRAIKRTFQYRGRTRPDMGEGCEERTDWQFLKWIWTYRRDKRPDILKMLKPLEETTDLYILTSPRQTEQFLNQLKGE